MSNCEFLIKLFQVIINDKVLVILSVTVIAILCVLKLPNSADTIVTSAFTGLFGIAVGRAWQRASDQQNGTPPNTGGSK